jgi:hypothetical protein
MYGLSLSLSLLFSQFTLVFGQRWKLMLSTNLKSLSLSLSLLFSQFTLVFGQRWKLMLSKNFKLRSVSADHFIWTLYQGSTSMVWDQVSWGLHVGVSHTLFHRINLGLFGILLEYFTMLHVAFEKIIRLIFF